MQLSNLADILQLASVASQVLKTINPLVHHYTPENRVIFGNFNQYTFETHPKNKKHFGYQAILEAIARVNGHNSYKSLLDSGQTELDPNSLQNALLSLNPYPLSKLQTAIWAKMINYVTTNIIKGIPPIAFQFKNNDEAAYLNCISLGIHSTFQSKPSTELSFRMDNHKPSATDLYVEIIATSIFLTAVKQILIPAYRSRLKDTKKESPPRIECYITPPLPLGDFLNVAKWSIDNYKHFQLELYVAIKRMFGAEITITALNSLPRYDQISIYLKNAFDKPANDLVLCKLDSYKRSLEKLQAVAINFKFQKDIADDETLYTHPIYRHPTNVDGYDNTELNNFLTQAMSDNPNKYGLWGTKLFWINIAPSLIPALSGQNLINYSPDMPLSTDNNHLNEENLADTKRTIQRLILDKLVPMHDLNLSTAHEYHYQLRINRISNSKFTGKQFIIPKHISIHSDYALSNEVALLMVQAELMKLSGNNAKFYGEPSTLICFWNNYVIDLKPSNLDQPEFFTNLLVVEIKRLRKPNPKSYAVAFKPEAIFESIEFNCDDNDVKSLHEVDVKKPLRISLRPMDTLLKMGFSDKDDCIDEILIEASRNNFDELQFDLLVRNINDEDEYSSNLRRKHSAEMKLLDEPFIVDLMEKFINSVKEMLPILAQQNSTHPTSMSSPYKIESFPHEFHYLVDNPISNLSKLEIELD